MKRFSKIQHEVCGIELVKHFVDCDYFSEYQRNKYISRYFTIAMEFPKGYGVERKPAVESIFEAPLGQE